MISQEEQKHWIRLAFSENIGPITFNTLLGYFGSAEEALKNLPDFSKKSGRKKPLTILSSQECELALKKMEKMGANFVLKGQEGYPSSLLPYPDMPIVLFFKGHLRYTNEKSVAIVGTRKPSLNSRNFSKYIAQKLSEKGIAITSGLAEGIDTAAHEGALERKGKTIAVLGTPLDQYYPKNNENLQKIISNDGCLLSEFLFGQISKKYNFPIRNRIISGLSLITIITEASMGSGSLHTARFALEQGKEIFAVPGFPLDPRFQGTNKLIKEGAHLLSSIEDIFYTLNTISEPTLFSEPPKIKQSVRIPTFSDIELTKAQEIILNSLGPYPMDIDFLIRESRLPTSLVQITLSGLEIAGRIERHTGNRVALLYQ